MEWMALAGHHHVHVPVELDPHWLASLHGGECDHGRERVPLGFLAAKAAAHPGRLHDDLVAGLPEHVGHHGLDLSNCCVDELTKTEPASPTSAHAAWVSR